MNSPKARKSHNNATLTIRLPEPILAQLTHIADAQYKTASVVVREEIVKYIQQNQIFLTAQQPTKPQYTRPNGGVIPTIGGVPVSQINRPQSPSQQTDVSSDWEY